MIPPKSLELLPKYYAPSSWWEHVPIAHWIVEKIKPNTIVELGTHYGVSFFSFCEAAECYSPNTYVYAVDTWEGDKQAGYYENDVYKKVYENRIKNHSQRSSMLRCMFEEAASQFSERSIDLIHIDGLHTYDAVKNDYETWKDKLKENGTIMFHDWNVREKSFGVWRLWDEIKRDANYQCIETSNGYGLGIATLSKTRPDWHDELEKDKQILITKGKLLQQLQQEREIIQALEQEKAILSQHAKNLEIIRDENLRNIDSVASNLKEANQTIELLQLEISHSRARNEKRLVNKLKKWIKRYI